MNGAFGTQRAATLSADLEMQVRGLLNGSDNNQLKKHNKRGLKADALQDAQHVIAAFM